jgi:hypothetical protein
MSMSRNWPSREEGAQSRRSIYWKDEHPCPATRRLSAYATTGEVATVIAELKAMIREHRQQKVPPRSARSDDSAVRTGALMPAWLRSTQARRAKL